MKWKALDLVSGDINTIHGTTYFPAVWLWANHLTSLNISSFLFSKWVRKSAILLPLTWGSHEVSEPPRYINKQTWHTSLTIPLLVDDQPPRGCHAREALFSCAFLPKTQWQKLNPLPPSTRSRTGISPSCQHGVETRGLIQSWCRAGSWVPALCKLLSFI